MRFLHGILIMTAVLMITTSCALNPCAVKLSDRAEAILNEKEPEPSWEPGIHPSGIKGETDGQDEAGADAMRSKSLPSGSRGVNDGSISDRSR